MNPAGGLCITVCALGALVRLEMVQPECYLC